MIQRRWMPAFRYLVQISWKRFIVLWLLGMVAMGLFNEVMQATGLLPNNDVLMMLYVICSVAMGVARVILRENPEYMPADQVHVEAHQVDVPAPQGQLAYAGWLLARMSWFSFIALCFVLLIMGNFLAGLVKPKTTVVTHDARPVRVIVHDSGSKTKNGKDAEILIDDSGVHISKAKPAKGNEATPAAPPPIPATPALPNSSDTGAISGSVTNKNKGDRKDTGSSRGVTIEGDKDAHISFGADGVRIEKMENGQKKVVTISGRGLEVNRADGGAADKSTQETTPKAVAAASGAPTVAMAEAQAALRKAQAAMGEAASDAKQAELEAQRAEQEAVKAEAEAEAAAEAAADADAQVVTIDLGKGDATQVAKAVREALTKARGTIEQDVREQIEQQQSDELSLPWDKVVKSLTLITLLLLTGLKIMANSQYAARASAIRATHRAEGETLKRQLSDAQLKAMQAQVEPHFLFNTLASVDYLIETAPAQASKMQKSLISYLRAALPQMRQASTTLGRETKLITSYLDILKVRMEERLQAEVDVPEALYSADFPPMMLQSLVENSIKHGLEPKPEGGSVKVKAFRHDDTLVIEVSDTGVGLSEKGVAPTAGTGIGLANIRERLQMLYGKRASFTLSPNMQGGAAMGAMGTIARVELPYQTSTASA